MLSSQEIFNRVRDHLLTQNAKAVVMGPNGETLCMYRDAHGLTCAVGCLITSAAYSKNMESLGVHDKPVMDALLASDINAFDSQTQLLLNELQIIHDGIDVCNWQEALHLLAEKFNLNP